MLKKHSHVEISSAYDATHLLSFETLVFENCRYYCRRRRFYNQLHPLQHYFGCLNYLLL